MSIKPDSASTAVVRSTRQKTPWSGVWATIGIGFIVIYCLAPFYWMVVSSLASRQPRSSRTAGGRATPPWRTTGPCSRPRTASVRGWSTP